MGRSIIRTLGLAVLAGAVAAPVLAQGSSVYTQSACVSARGHTSVAAPCADASGIYYNPGMLALMPSALSAGFTAVHNFGTFTYQDGREVSREAATPIVPHGYTSIRFGGEQRMAVGFGVFAPYGLGIEWPEDFEGRFISWKTQLRGLYLQPTLSYQVIPGRLAIGAGPQIVLGSLELNQDQDAAMIPTGHPTFPRLGHLGVPQGTAFARGNLSGSGTGVGGQVGIFFQATPQLSVGARYMHSVPVDLSGDAAFTQLQTNQNVTGPFGPNGQIVTVPLDAFVAGQFQDGMLVDQDVDASLTFPAQAVLGLRFAATHRLDLSAEYQWTGWSSFDQIEAELAAQPQPVVLTLNYQDAHTFRFGGSYMATHATLVRAGFLFNTAATPDETVTPILPEAERWLLTAGLGHDFGAIRADVFYNLVNQQDREGRVRSENMAGQTGVDLNRGTYSTTAHLFGLTLSYGLGTIR
jgi:long-chain fatty acid transport protein